MTTRASRSAACPEPGQIAFVRQRRYLVERVVAPPAVGDATLVKLSCLDDDAQGEPLTVLWEHEVDARVVEDDGWSSVAERGFDDPELFAAYLRTLFVELRNSNRSEPISSTVSRRYSNRRLSARAAAQGPSPAASESVHRRRRGSWQNDRGGAHCTRTAAASSDRPYRRRVSAVHARPMARRNGNAFWSRIHDPGQSIRNTHAPRAWLFSQPLDDPFALFWFPTACLSTRPMLPGCATGSASSRHNLS